MKYLILFLLVALLYGPDHATADDVPNLHLRVTVQQKTEGKLEKGFHVIELTCWEGGQCSLTSVSLNQCMESSSGKKAFYPRVQYSSTWIGNLKVRNEGNTLIVQETGSDIFGDYTNNMRFDYEPVKDHIVTRLTGFNGGYVKNSTLLKKILTTEYIPLPKADQVISLDCGVLLPGVDKK